MKLILYSASWCTACPSAKKNLEKASLELGVPFAVEEVDGPDGSNDGIAQTICSLPTLVGFNDMGMELGRKTGLCTIQGYKTFIKDISE